MSRPDSTRDTVACETPASLATSACLGRARRPAGAGALPGLARPAASFATTTPLRRSVALPEAVNAHYLMRINE
ncbi:hypothetical protein RGQ21_06160 [Kitasatospora aureofaciens]|nr:hypothetical protein RGQ21_06160 [Kitasatospora aureofaciens]